MMLKNHLDMIGRNEPIQRKARFWQNYVRALKGTDDMRAPDPVHRPRSIYRPLLSEFPELSSSWPSYGKSIYDEPKYASDRISVPGYRYLPVSRETYGYSPRNLYPLPSLSYSSYRPGSYDALQDWRDHLDRMSAFDHLYPKKYPAVLHRSPTPFRESTPLKSFTPERELGYHYPGTYNPIVSWKEHLERMFPLYHQYHLYPRLYPTLRHRSLSPFREWTPLKASILEDELGFNYHASYNRIQAYKDYLDRMAALDRLYPNRYPAVRHKTPTLLRDWKLQPDKQVGYNYAGQPIYTRGGLARRPLSELLEPLPSMPLSNITRDPWWWDYPELRPFTSPYAYLHPSPFYLRDSYLSPVKRTYLWDKHPIRPFAHVF